MIGELLVKNWIELLFLIITSIVTWSYRTLITKFKEEREVSVAIAEGVKCLLRQEIVASYHIHVEDMGYCPVPDKEALSMAYKSYSNLHGNDIATNLYQRVMALPTEPPGEE